MQDDVTILQWNRNIRIIGMFYDATREPSSGMKLRPE